MLGVSEPDNGVVTRVPTGTDLVVGSHAGAVELFGGEVRVTNRVCSPVLASPERLEHGVANQG